MKKNLFLISVAAAALAACTNESTEFVGAPEVREIAFSTLTQNVTRSAIDGTTFPTTSTMQVAAYNATTGANYFAGTQFAKGTTYWEGATKRYWPLAAAYINFLAYTGVTGTAAFDDTNYASAATINQIDNSSVQADLMYAIGQGEVTEAGGVLSFPDKVDMTFKHAQAWVRFTVKAYSSNEADITLNSITLNGGKYAGKYTITHTNYNASTGQSVEGIWDLTGIAAQNVTVPEWTAKALTTTETTVGDGLVIVPDDDNSTGDFTSFTVSYSHGGTPYFRYFRNQGFNPTEDNEAGEAWTNESQWKEYYQNMPYTWTYEEILFPRSNVRYDYDEILEVGDLLTSEGNIVKANDADGTEVGRVMWIAYGCRELVAAKSANADEDGWFYDEDEEEFYFLDYYPDHRDDNGYRTKGRETDGTAPEDYGKRHFVVDWSQTGASSLDDYWKHDVCNHFLVFKLGGDVDCGQSPIAWNEGIFGTAIPASLVFDGSGYKGGFSLADYYFLSNTNYSACLRSAVSAADWGYSHTADLPWMVPTIPQYEVALSEYLEYEMPANPLGITIVSDLTSTTIRENFFNTALLSSSLLAESGEGMVLTCSTFQNVTSSNSDYTLRSYALYLGEWGGRANYYRGGLRYDDFYSYILHVPIRKTDSLLPFWFTPKNSSSTSLTNEKKVAPPTAYRPCIAF